jgi:hypothetical protein
MRDIHEVIREKESEVKRINGELETLRMALRLLEEDDVEMRRKSPSPVSARENPSPTRTGSATQFP